MNEQEKELEEARRYGGEFRYVNLGPQKLRELMAREADPEEKKAMLLALEFWSRKQPGGCEAGEPYRGEPREAVHAKSMLELGKAVKPVDHVYVRGCFEDVSGGDTGVIDFDALTSEGQ